jgi:hypothetical protein
MDYRELQREIKKFNALRLAGKIGLVQKKSILLREFMTSLEHLGAKIPEKTPKDDDDAPLDGVMNSLNSLSICDVVTLNLEPIILILNLEPIILILNLTLTLTLF